jgi:hypothetical protein
MMDRMFKSISGLSRCTENVDFDAAHRFVALEAETAGPRRHRSRRRKPGWQEDRGEPPLGRGSLGGAIWWYRKRGGSSAFTASRVPVPKSRFPVPHDGTERGESRFRCSEASLRFSAARQPRSIPRILVKSPKSRPMIREVCSKRCDLASSNNERRVPESSPRPLQSVYI